MDLWKIIIDEWYILIHLSHDVVNSITHYSMISIKIRGETGCWELRDFLRPSNPHSQGWWYKSKKPYIHQEITYHRSSATAQAPGATQPAASWFLEPSSCLIGIMRFLNGYWFLLKGDISLSSIHGTACQISSWWIQLAHTSTTNIYQVYLQNSYHSTHHSHLHELQRIFVYAVQLSPKFPYFAVFVVLHLTWTASSARKLMNKQHGWVC